MCLTVKKGCRPEIAEKDILCFKVVERYSSKSWTPYYVGGGVFSYNTVINAKKVLFCQSTREWWNFERIVSDIKQLNVLSIVPEDIYPAVETINEGFHSCCNFLGALSNCGYQGSTKLCICIIPKGAEYCLGDDHDIVSTQIIVFSSLREYIKYKLGKK